MSPNPRRPSAPPRPGAVLAVCCLSLLIVGVDNTIVTIALPDLRADLHASFAAAQWTVDAYQLVLGAFLVLAGATADRWGRRRTLQVGLGVFTVASALCGLAPSMPWLIAFRVLQALGGSMMNPVAMAIVSRTYPEPARRARAFGVWSGVYGLSMAIGPIVGGLLAGSVGWRYVFWVTVPVGILAIVGCALVVPESRAPRPRRADPVGQTLIVVVLLAVTYVIVEGRDIGWTSPLVLGLIAVAVLAAVALVRVELRRAEPLVDPRFFASAPFSGGVVVALLGMAVGGGYLWMMTFYLQEARGLSPVAAGILLTPVAATVLVVAPVSGRLAARLGPRIPLVLAGTGLAGSALTLVGLAGGTRYAVLVVSFLLFGLGFGMLNAPVTALAVAGMPAAQAGVASAVASTGRQVGQALGVAVVGAIVVPRIVGPATLPAASRPGWWVLGLAGLAVVAVAWLTTGAAARRSARRVADRLLDDRPAATLGQDQALRR